MEFNLLDTVKGLFTNDLVTKAASSLGESEGGIQKALSGAIPTALTGLLSKAGAGGGASGVLDMAKQAAGSGVAGNLGGLLGGAGTGMGTSGIMNMASGLFGDKLSGITRAISSFSGIKESSASSLLGMASAGGLSSLGQHATQTNLSPSGLLSLLHGQKDAILSAVPSGLGLGGLLGLAGLGDIGAKLSGSLSAIGGGAKQAASSAAGFAENTAKKVGGGSKWLLPLLLILIAIAAVWYFMNRSGKSTSETAGTADTVQTAVAAPDTAAASTAAMAEKVSMKVKLPNGQELDAYKGGIEDQLVSFLNTDYKKLGADSLKKIWFDFDNLNFKTGSAELTPESQHQIDNITAILKAYPKTSLKVGGYTDKTGNEASNKKLSADRANAVKAALTKAGVGAQVTGADGYGSAYAKYPADAPETDRVKDRHVSVSVRG